MTNPEAESKYGTYFRKDMTVRELLEGALAELPPQVLDNQVLSLKSAYMSVYDPATNDWKVATTLEVTTPELK